MADRQLGEQDIRRSLIAHAPLRRRPHNMVRRMLDWLPPDTPLYGPNAPVGQLEARMAELLGKPRALFFPSGTMAQQVALRIHAERSGRPTFTAHPDNHLDQSELRGYAAVHGLRYLPAGDQNRLLTLDDLREVTEPVSTLLIELPQRGLGGVLPTWDELTAQIQWARDRGAVAHLDGARLWEAQTYYDRPHAEIAGLFDTVYVSLYKGLEGVRGAVLAGDEDTIGHADVWRQRLGGALPDAWPLAVAALIGLDEVLPRMPAFRDHAVALAKAITAGGVAAVTPDPPQTPMFTCCCRSTPKRRRRRGTRYSPKRGCRCSATWVPSRCPGGPVSSWWSARTRWSSPPTRSRCSSTNSCGGP